MGAVMRGHRLADLHRVDSLRSERAKTVGETGSVGRRARAGDRLFWRLVEGGLVVDSPVPVWSVCPIGSHMRNAQVNTAIKRFYEFGEASKAEVDWVMHNVGVVTPSTQVPPSTPVPHLSSFRCFGSAARLNSVKVAAQKYLLDHPGALTQR